MNKSLRRLAAPLLAGALLLGACSDGGGGGEEEAAENPKQAFTEALDALAEYDGVTLGITIEADPAALQEEDTPPEAAEAIVNSSLTISAKGETAEDAQAQVIVNVDGDEDAAEFRFVDQSLYLRADVGGLVEKFGGDRAQVDAFAQQASAQGFDFAQALVDGEWVGMEGLDQVAEQLGLPQPSADPEQASKLAEQVATVLEQNSQVSSEGTDDVGAHLVVEVPLRETLEELASSLQTIANAPPLPTEDLAEVPDADIPIDVWVSDGRLVQLEFDVVAIATAAGDPPPDNIDEFAIRVTVDEFTDDVEPPSEFAEIDVQQLIESFFGASMGMVGESSAGTSAVAPGGNREVVVPELGLACSDLQMLSPQEIEAFLSSSGVPGALKKVKQGCPELF
ncbi:MAG: hypothetical protein M3134_02810 [Actinomycetota bacterium]|nr:hypothetical protein [Actinomycetota bacterium]